MIKLSIVLCFLFSLGALAEFGEPKSRITYECEKVNGEGGARIDVYEDSMLVLINHRNAKRANAFSLINLSLYELHFLMGYANSGPITVSGVTHRNNPLSEGGYRRDYRVGSGFKDDFRFMGSDDNLTVFIGPSSEGFNGPRSGDLFYRYLKCGLIEEN